MAVRRADRTDAEVTGRLLHDFNVEFEEATPGPQRLAERVERLLDGGDTDVLLAGDPPAGVAVLRARRSLWTDGLEGHLAELYVVPDRRGEGLGRALLEAVLDRARERGVEYMDLNTDEDDVAAHALYEKLGFRRTAHYYEREL